MSDHHSFKVEKESITGENIQLCMTLIKEHLERSIEMVELDRVREMIKDLTEANRIFVLGVGRSGLVARAFAMRLMHLGFNVYVVGETTTPAVREGDLVVAISGSGQTSSVVDLARIAVEIGAELVAVTSNPESPLGRLGDVVVEIPGRTSTDAGGYLERHMRGKYTTLAPLGTIFEITALIFLDAIIAELMNILEKSEADLKSRHAVLE